mmetsp:Transcript_6030/g.26640  ORF Transcript_6030/g.26640 Transcript_6030/m.26640 type:complete len:214 (-) Transcript_6030:2-643(-)
MRRRVQVGPGHRRRRHRRPKNAPRGAPAREESAAAQRRRGRAEARRARRSVVWVARAPLPHLPRGGSHLGPTSAEPHEGHERPEAPGLLGAPLIANSDAAALHGRPVVRRPASVGARGRHVLGVHLLLLRPEHPSGLVHRPRQRELGHGAGRVPSSVGVLTVSASSLLAGVFTRGPRSRRVRVCVRAEGHVRFGGVGPQRARADSVHEPSRTV